MLPQTSYIVNTTSNTDRTAGLSNPEMSPWSPAVGDVSPSVSIAVAGEEDKFIESLTITKTENVGSVTVVVIRKDGTNVSCRDILIHL